MKPIMFAAACLGGSLIALPAAAAEPTDNVALKAELEALKADYEQRLRALEAQLDAQPSPTTATGAAAARPSLSSNAFNPAISAIIMGSYASYDFEAERELAGFQLGGETDYTPEGLSLNESELIFSGNIDHRFFGQLTLGIHDGEEGAEVEIEEAFFDTRGLPGGTGLRFGRFYSDIGYLNRQHPHAWNFHDAPLPYLAFLGGQLGDDGIQATWVAPTNLYLAFGTEIYQGESFPGGSAADFGDVATAFAHLGGDVGRSHSWRAGLSALWADAEAREGGGHAHGGEAGPDVEFTGDSDLLIADFVWKWAPNGDFRSRSFTLQAEYFYRDEAGAVEFVEGTDSAELSYDGTQRGWYVEGVYGFGPQWRAGLRYDRLSSSNDLVVESIVGALTPDEVLEESGLVSPDRDPERWAAMVDYAPSEFSRLRLQYTRDETLDEANDIWVLQYIMSLGAHGAHQF